MGRRLTGVAVAAGCALAAATAAWATPADDARATAGAFAGALANGDAATACSLLTPELSAKLSGGSTCIDALTDDPSEEAASQDELERNYLTTAFVAARGATAVDPGGQFPLPARRLAREMHAQIPDLRVVVGAGPGAARNEPPKTIVLDSRRTTKRHLVLYAESDSGTIFVLTANLSGSPRIAPATKGVPAPKPPPTPVTAVVESVDLAGAETAYAVVRLTEGSESYHIVLKLKLLDGAWRVDDLLLSLADLAELASGGVGSAGG